MAAPEQGHAHASLPTAARHDRPRARDLARRRSEGRSPDSTRRCAWASRPAAFPGRTPVASWQV